MPNGKLEIPILSYDNLRSIATRFLNEHHPKGGLPIPIERIVEYELNIDISPEMSIQYVCDIDAFINPKCTTIYVDSEVYMSPNANRFRFSLAHEVAHYVLHRNVMSQLNFATMAEWKSVHASIPKEQHEWLEWQAHSLGGLILVPEASLAAEFAKATRIVEAENTLANDKDVMKYAVEGHLAEAFSISREIIQRRCVKDGLC